MRNRRRTSRRAEEAPQQRRGTSFAPRRRLGEGIAEGGRWPQRTRQRRLARHAARLQTGLARRRQGQMAGRRGWAQASTAAVGFSASAGKRRLLSPATLDVPSAVAARLQLFVRVRPRPTPRPAENRDDLRMPGGDRSPRRPRAARRQRVATQRRKRARAPPLRAAAATGPTHGSARSRSSTLTAVAGSCDYSSGPGRRRSVTAAPAIRDERQQRCLRPARRGRNPTQRRSRTASTAPAVHGERHPRRTASAAPVVHGERHPHLPQPARRRQNPTQRRGRTASTASAFRG